MRAIVIGAGIGGLSCALGLRKIGVDVVVYERAPEIREVGAGIMLWANALRALMALDVWEHVHPVVMPVTQMHLAASKGHRVQLTITSNEIERRVRFAPPAGFAHRAELVNALAAPLPVGTVQCGFDCIGIEEIAHRVRIRFANGHADEADLLIGADGIHSRVRRQLFDNREPRYAGYTCWRGIAPRPDGFSPGEVQLWTGPGSQVGINSLPGDRVYWFATKNAPFGRRASGGHAGDEHATVMKLFADWASPLPEVLASMEPSKVIRADIIDRPPSRPWAQGRSVLVGDAAHSTTPNFGQGGGMAIEDAVVLARRLRSSMQDVPSALQAFEKERFRRTSAITNEAWRFGKMLQWEGRISSWMRDQLSTLLFRFAGADGLFKHALFDVGSIPAN